MEKVRVLIIDNDEKTKKLFRKLLDKNQYRIFTASDETEALSVLKRRMPTLIFLNLHLPHANGVPLLEKIKNKTSDIVVMGERTSDDPKCLAHELGVAGSIIKPLDEKQVFRITSQILIKAMQKNKPNGSLVDAYRPLIGASQKMKELMQIIRKVASSTATILIDGPSGVGKELVARAIHHFSPRREKPFITVNCAAVPAGLMESELFGVRQGAYTGAVANREGKLELADGGTLVLDEIGDLDFSLQAKLLRVLQEKEVTPLGGSFSRRVNVRIVAITNQDLKERVREGRFREDLYYRLNVIPITPPKLQERREDIPSLVDHFLARFNEENQRNMRGITEQALNALLSYHWPGNIRELENAIEKAVVLGDNDKVHLNDLPPHIVEEAEGSPSPAVHLSLGRVN